MTSVRHVTEHPKRIVNYYGPQFLGSGPLFDTFIPSSVAMDSRGKSVFIQSVLIVTNSCTFQYLLKTH